MHAPQRSWHWPNEANSRSIWESNLEFVEMDCFEKDSQKVKVNQSVLTSELRVRPKPLLLDRYCELE